MGGAPLGLRSLADMVHILMRVHDFNDLLELAADHARRALGAATVSISLIEPDRDQIRTVINVGDLGPDEERWPEDEIYPITGDRRLMISLGELRSLTDSIDDPECDPGERELLIRLGKGSSMTTPIIVDGECWAEFYATRHVADEIFDDEMLAYAEVLSAILGSAISRVQSEANLEDLAFHDPLTGLYNRRALDDHAATMFSVPEGISRLVTIVAADMVGLKRVNDSLGHASGDEQITRVASALTLEFDSLAPCVIARVGGDEFTVMVADQPTSKVVDAINEVCRQVAIGQAAVGVSAGVAAARLTAKMALEPSDLFAAADRAQYVAKRSKSRVAVVSQEFST